MTFYAAKENVNRVCICYFCGYNPLTADNMDKISFNQVVSRGCGIDVHKESVMATIDGEGIRKVTKPFGTFTSPLTDLRDWLLENGITHVAMELGCFLIYHKSYNLAFINR